jgi:hypothetical protein
MVEFDSLLGSDNNRDTFKMAVPLIRMHQRTAMISDPVQDQIDQRIWDNRKIWLISETNISYGNKQCLNDWRPNRK